jgi:hypothetical protein
MKLCLNGGMKTSKTGKRDSSKKSRAKPSYEIIWIKPGPPPKFNPKPSK